jgi:hypothetical protein
VLGFVPFEAIDRVRTMAGQFVVGMPPHDLV